MTNKRLWGICYRISQLWHWYGEFVLNNDFIEFKDKKRGIKVRYNDISRVGVLKIVFGLIKLLYVEEENHRATLFLIDSPNHHLKKIVSCCSQPLQIVKVTYPWFYKVLKAIIWILFLFYLERIVDMWIIQDDFSSISYLIQSYLVIYPPVIILFVWRLYSLKKRFRETPFIKGVSLMLFLPVVGVMVVEFFLSRHDTITTNVKDNLRLAKKETSHISNPLKGLWYLFLSINLATLLVFHLKDIEGKFLLTSFLNNEIALFFSTIITLSIYLIGGGLFIVHKDNHKKNTYAVFSYILFQIGTIFGIYLIPIFFNKVLLPYYFWNILMFTGLFFTYPRDLHGKSNEFN